MISYLVAFTITNGLKTVIHGISIDLQKIKVRTDKRTFQRQAQPEGTWSVKEQRVI